jgi:hypothetical protein
VRSGRRDRLLDASVSFVGRLLETCSGHVQWSARDLSECRGGDLKVAKGFSGHSR